MKSMLSVGREAAALGEVEARRPTISAGSMIGMISCLGEALDLGRRCTADSSGIADARGPS